MAHAHSNASADDPTVEFGHLPPRWSPTPAHPRLPIGVGVLSVVVGLVGVVFVLAGVLFLLGVVAPALAPASVQILTTLGETAAVVLVALGATLIVVANSLWRQETWALWTVILLVFLTEAYLFFTVYLTVLFVLFLLVFMYLISVRRYFY